MAYHRIIVVSHVTITGTLTDFVALLWMRSKHSISFFSWGDHACTQYSK